MAAMGGCCSRSSALRSNRSCYHAGQDISLPGLWMAVVCRYSGTYNRNSPNRWFWQGRPVYIYTHDRDTHHCGVGYSGFNKKMELPEIRTVCIVSDEHCMLFYRHMDSGEIL